MGCNSQLKYLCEFFFSFTTFHPFIFLLLNTTLQCNVNILLIPIYFTFYPTVDLVFALHWQPLCFVWTKFSNSSPKKEYLASFLYSDYSMNNKLTVSFFWSFTLWGDEWTSETQCCFSFGEVHFKLRLWFHFNFRLIHRWVYLGFSISVHWVVHIEVDLYFFIVNRFLKGHLRSIQFDLESINFRWNVLGLLNFLLSLDFFW